MLKVKISLAWELNIVSRITFSRINFILFFETFILDYNIVNWLIYSIVIVSVEQQRDSAIHIHVSILPQTPLPSRLPHGIEQHSLCYKVGACWLSILNIAVCTYHWSTISFCVLPNHTFITWTLMICVFICNLHYIKSYSAFYPLGRVHIQVLSSEWL